MSTASTTRAASSEKAPSLTLPILGLAAAVVLIIAGIFMASRRATTLPSTYGKRRGTEAAASVSGRSGA